MAVRAVSRLSDVCLRRFGMAVIRSMFGAILRLSEDGRASNLARTIFVAALYETRPAILEHRVMRVLWSAIVVPVWAMGTGHDGSPAWTVHRSHAQHRLAAVRTRGSRGGDCVALVWGCVVRSGTARLRIDRLLTSRQQLAALGEITFAVVVAKATVASRLHDTLGENVQSPATHELDPAQFYGDLFLVAAGLVALAS